MRYFISFIITILVGTHLLAQQNSASPMHVEMRAQTNAAGDVMLRWAPVDFKTFDYGNNYGYRLSRITYTLNGQPVSMSQTMYQEVLETKIKPWHQAKWETLMNADSTDWPELGAGAIFGQNFTVLDPDTADIMDVVNLNREHQNQFSFGLFAAEQSYTVALAMGLGYIDTTTAPNSEYTYIIELVNANAEEAQPSRLPVNTAVAPNLPVARLSVESGDRQATLRWERDELEKAYNSYMVERSSDGGNTWIQLNDKPLVFITENDAASNAMYYTDSLAQNGVSYQYRVRGQSTFGIAGPASNTSIAIGAPGPVAGINITASVEEQNQGAMRITWQIPANVLNQIAIIDVLRAEDNNKDYSPVNSAPLPANTTEFIDQAPYPANYYIVECTDINGYTHRSIALLGQPNDATPPLPTPTPTAVCDNNGHVRISWAPSTSSDVMGYRVFMSNNNRPGDMIQITPDWIRDTVFNYTIAMNTLSEDIFFAVKAVDFRENSSSFSPVGSAVRPDVIPPAPPVIKEYTFVAEGVQFKFIASSSTDVVQYKFERRIKGYVDWELLTTLTEITVKPFIDTTANRRWHYQYRLVAYDEVNLAGSSNILEIKPFDDGMRAPITHLQAFKFNNGGLQPEPSGVLLTWDYTAATDPDFIGFQIMRSVGGDPMRSLVFLAPQAAAMSNLSFPGPHNFPGAFGYFDLDVATFKKLTQQGMVSPVAMANPPITPGPLGVGTRYTVYAKYIDGAMSPLSSVTVVW